MSHILFHVPHSSLYLPKRYKDICIKDKEYINKINKEISDYQVDKLLPSNCNAIIFKYSRLFCDVERFKDDKQEVMAKLGMGVIYQKDFYGTTLTIPNKKYRNRIIKSYYDSYHNKLDKLVTNRLNKYHKCLIIDFHSYSDLMVEKLFNITNNLDICIGTDPYYTNKELLSLTINHFKEYGYTVSINTPYNGTIIPNKYINKKINNLASIMIEINKRCYLNNQESFIKMQKCIDDYYQKIQAL